MKSYMHTPKTYSQLTRDKDLTLVGRQKQSEGESNKVQKEFGLSVFYLC